MHHRDVLWALLGGDDRVLEAEQGSALATEGTDVVPRGRGRPALSGWLGRRGPGWSGKRPRR